MGRKCGEVEVSHKSEMAGPFNRGDTIINKHLTFIKKRYVSVLSMINVILFFRSASRYVSVFSIVIVISTGPCIAVGNVSGNRCKSVCRSRGREFDPQGPISSIKFVGYILNCAYVVF